MYINICIYIKNCYNYILWNTCGNQKENTYKIKQKKKRKESRPINTETRKKKG